MQPEPTLDPSNQLLQQLQDLRERKDLLERIFDTLQIGISVFHPERDEYGRIIDFRIVISNKEVERQTGRTDLAGLWYAREYPGIVDVGIFDIMLRVLDTGIPEQLEYFYKEPGFNRWFSAMFVKIDDGLIATNIDVERVKNHTMLRQTEELAMVGNWAYDLGTAQFTWTHGMYSIFNLRDGEKVTPEIYLRYATEKSLPAARKIVRCITTGEGSFEKTIEINVKSSVKHIKIKGTVVKNEDGRPMAVTGIDIDVSRQVKLEQEKLKLQAQYKEILARHNKNILKITLETQEAERKRMSDSLHNGLGQLLYAVKLSLEQLTLKSDDLQHINNIKRNTSMLLTAAIKETRRISHELSPSILQNFGLKVAIQDICQQFDPALNIKCDVQDTPIRLSKELELFLYRTIQELMTNIIKHAEATEACLEVFFSKDQVNVNIRDNGKGIKNDAAGDGIGLKTIRNHLDLLKGSFKISSPGGIGTLINICIPHASNKASADQRLPS
jgi:signal transduction histidine kinase